MSKVKALFAGLVISVGVWLGSTLVQPAIARDEVTMPYHVSLPVIIRSDPPDHDQDGTCWRDSIWWPEIRDCYPDAWQRTPTPTPTMTWAIIDPPLPPVNATPEVQQ